MLTVNIKRKTNRVQFIKDWDIKSIGIIYNPLVSAKLMESESACKLQTVLLDDVSNRCFNRIKERARK